ncbi:hypothetical protein [Embleya sp. NPDC005971]|uniref:hypothetical protein n=1 Tax=Embleya sp. NPDC005971 TaxID=3156724 RepID=UPI0033FA99B6
MDENDNSREYLRLLARVLGVYRVIELAASLLPIPITLPDVDGDPQPPLEDVMFSVRRAWVLLPEQIGASEIAQAALQSALTHWLVAVDMLALHANDDEGEEWRLTGALLNLRYAMAGARLAVEELSELADE